MQFHVSASEPQYLYNMYECPWIVSLKFMTLKEGWPSKHKIYVDLHGYLFELLETVNVNIVFNISVFKFHFSSQLPEINWVLMMMTSN